jgi:hypothetical protein
VVVVEAIIGNKVLSLFGANRRSRALTTTSSAIIVAIQKCNLNNGVNVLTYPSSLLSIWGAETGVSSTKQITVSIDTYYDFLIFSVSTLCAIKEVIAYIARPDVRLWNLYIYSLVFRCNERGQIVSYPIGSPVTFRKTPYTIERFIPVDKVPTKCKLQDRGPGYNLYIVRNVEEPSKSAFVWESELDLENKIEQAQEEAVSM